MREFFKGWRRKAGCVVASTACAGLLASLIGYLTIRNFYARTGNRPIPDDVLIAMTLTGPLLVAAIPAMIASGLAMLAIAFWKSKPKT